MEQIYALGVTCIQFIQEWFKDYEWYLEMVNDVSNPHHITEIVFPLLSVVDSVFAAQLLLCMAFGGWLNAVMKWWFLEDRPYWWVQETTYYTNERPSLFQNRQTCETGPGSPSGHSCAIALALTLCVTCLAHVARDRKWCIPPLVQKLGYILFLIILGSVMIARMYVSAHFPHQCLLGALIGLFLGPGLCIYISDPYIWRYGAHAKLDVKSSQRWHITSALLTITIACFTYLILKICKQDPQNTVKLAFRWCQGPENIHLSTTPMFTLVQTTAYLLGWAIAVTPAVAQYRHDTRNRSLVISAFATALVIYGYKQVNDNLCKSNTLTFYVSQFVMYALKPMILLRLIPMVSMWPFGEDKIKID